MRRTIAAAVLLCSPASYAQSKPDPISFPELQQHALLPQIIGAMRRELRDPNSVNDLTVCHPIKIKMKDAQPVRWTVMLSFNAKNGFVGYVGRSYYAAIFNAEKGPRLTEIMSASADGLDGLIANAIEKQMAGCPHIPDLELRRLLDS